MALAKTRVIDAVRANAAAAAGTTAAAAAAVAPAGATAEAATAAATYAAADDDDDDADMVSLPPMPKLSLPFHKAAAAAIAKSGSCQSR
jgi:hypothetical protein